MIIEGHDTTEVNLDDKKTNSSFLTSKEIYMRVA
jgi:hypothetical protein